MPELKTLAPKQAFEMVVQAQAAEQNANFWREMSTRSVLLGLSLAAFLVAIIVVLVVNDLSGLFILILPVLAVWAVASRRKDQSRRLRPRILALLKARSPD